MSSADIHGNLNQCEQEKEMIQIAENPSREPHIFYVFYNELKSIYDTIDLFIILDSIATGGDIDMFKFMLNEIKRSNFQILTESEKWFNISKIITTILAQSHEALLIEMFKLLTELNINTDRYLELAWSVGFQNKTSNLVHHINDIYGINSTNSQ